MSRARDLPADAQLTTLIARPPAWQRAQRWPGALLLAVGLWSFAFGFEPAALAFVAVGFWGTAEFWRGVRVTGGELVAQGRLTRRRIPLAALRQVGWSPARTIWVQPREGRTVALPMAQKRTDQPGSHVEVLERLRELAVEAGADLDPDPEAPTPAPRPSTPFFGW